MTLILGPGGYKHNLLLALHGKGGLSCSCSDLLHSFNRLLCENVKISTLILTNIE
jgi:hypothetical protein